MPILGCCRKECYARPMGNVCLVALMLSSYPIHRMVARCCKGHKMLLPFASYASADYSQLLPGRMVCVLKKLCVTLVLLPDLAAVSMEDEVDEVAQRVLHRAALSFAAYIGFTDTVDYLHGFLAGETAHPTLVVAGLPFATELQVGGYG